MSNKYQYNKNNKSGWRPKKKKYYLARKKEPSRFKKIFERKNNRSSSLKKKLLIFGLLSVLAILMLLVIYVSWLSRNLPDPNHLIDREVAQSTKIYDRTGDNILYEIHGNEKRTLISINDIPAYIKNATIAIEDKNYYKHGGFSLWAMFRTMITNVLRHEKAGGSTLTQQFIKNAVLSNEKTYTRKIKELLLAYKLEKRFSKEEILQMYLNEIPYGSTAYGIEAASQKYFNKSAKDISLAEATILAALPQAPTRYSPYGSNKQLLIDRQHYILDIMTEQGYITKEEADAAKQEKLTFNSQNIKIKAPHFVMYVRELLSEKYGEKTIEQGGLKIITTLDLYKQEIAEKIISELAEKNAEKYQATNASLVAIDPKNGQILTMVGSRDYFNDDIDGQVNIATSKRQPGSSLKPLVYASMFLRGYTPDTILYDVITNFSNNSEEPYEPHNYDNEEHGPVTIRKALAGSLNIPAVKAIYLAGIDNVLDLAHDMGYSTLNERDRYGLALVLGGGEVKLLEHTNAYSAFAREGLLHPVSAILRVEDKDGKVLEEYEDKEKKVLDPKIARYINNILSDNDARAYAFGTKNWLTLGERPVAAKTGTTNDYRDAWTIGYTPSIVTGVWVGNNDNSKMKKGAAGGTVAAPIWHDFMKKILGDTPVEYFRTPNIPKTGKDILDGEAGIQTSIKIDKSTGLLATEYTPKSYIIEQNFSQPHCILYYVNKDDPLGEIPKNPENDPQFKLWEDGVIAWSEKEGITSSTTPIFTKPPTESDNLHIPENIPQLEVITPVNNQTITKPLLTSRIKVSAARGVDRVEYYLNNNLLYTARSFPYNLEQRINFLPNGFHKLTIRVCDDIDNCKQEEKEINLILNNNSNNEKVELTIVRPDNGLAVTNFDFPINIEMETSNPLQTAKIELFYESENQKNILGLIQPVNSKNVSFTWSDVPKSNTYKIWANLHTWSDEIIKSNVIIITINNIQKKTEVKTPINKTE